MIYLFSSWYLISISDGLKYTTCACSSGGILAATTELPSAETTTSSAIAISGLPPEFTDLNWRQNSQVVYMFVVILVLYGKVVIKFAFSVGENWENLILK